MSEQPMENEENEGNEVATLTSQLKEARSDAAKNRKALRALNDKLEGVDLERYSELMKDAEEAKQKSEEEKGNYSKVLEDMKRNHEVALTKANDTIKSLTKGLEIERVDNQLIPAAARSIDAKKVTNYIKSEFDFSLNSDGNIEVKKDGEVIYDDAGKLLTPSKAMENYLADNPHLVSASQNQGSGSQQQQRQKAAGDKSTGDKVRDGLSALLNA